MADEPTAKSYPETANLRASVQWIIATAAALVAAFLARIPATDLTALSPAAAVVSTAALALAAVLACAILVMAARVLTVAPLSVSVIATRQGAHRGQQARRPTVPPEVIASVVEGQASELLGSFQSVDDALAAKRDAHARLTTARSLPAEERELVLAQLADVDRRLNDLRATVHYETSLVRHARLLRALPWLGGGIVVSLVTCLVAPALLPATAAEIGKPTPVTVHISDVAAAGMAPGCPQQRDGVAVGGTREAPVVVLQALSDTCPARTLTAGGGIAVTFTGQGR